MVFIGDLCDGAGELGVRNVAFMPGGLRSGLRAGVPRDRPPHARGLLPLHPWRPPCG